MEELFRVVAGLLVQKPERLSGAEARFLRRWLGWSGHVGKSASMAGPGMEGKWLDGIGPARYADEAQLGDCCGIRVPE